MQSPPPSGLPLGVFLATLVACTSPTGSSTTSDVPPPDTDSGTMGTLVTTAGGEAASENGKAKATFPAGALPASASIIITPVADPPPNPLLVPSTAFDFGPSGSFAQPVTLTISYAEADVPTTTDPTRLRLHRLTEGVWVELPGSSVDVGASRVSGQTSSFSTYAVLGTEPPQEFVLTTGLNVMECSVGTAASCGLSAATGALLWTVPADVYTATFELWGAGGGGPLGLGLGAGKGGKTTSTLVVIPGEVLQIRLGEAGGFLTAKNGGGHGGFGEFNWPTATGEVGRNGHAGGGATDVRRGSPLTVDLPGQPTRLAVAGGGGGDGGYRVDLVSPGLYVATSGAPGGTGGGFAGGSGGTGDVVSNHTAATGGNGGGQLSPGSAGVSSNNPSTSPPGAGAPEAGDPIWGGGDGGTEQVGGGGGGGGWYGGGGGGSTWGGSGAGGGGGSSFGPDGSTFFQGVNAGEGRATITFSPSPGLTPTTVALTSSANPSPKTQALTFTAVVALKPPTVGPAPGGGVRFEVDGVVVGGGPVALVDGHAVSAAVANLSPGPHDVVIIYLGSGALAPSSAQLVQTVTP